MSAVAATTFKITNTKWYVPIVTLSSIDNAKTIKKLVKLLEEGFKTPVYWNEYQKKKKIETRNLDGKNLTRFPLDASFRVVRRLFLLLITQLLMFLIIQLTILAIELKETVSQNLFFQE